MSSSHTKFPNESVLLANNYYDYLVGWGWGGDAPSEYTDTS